MGAAMQSEDMLSRVLAFFERLAPPEVVSAYVFGSYAENRAHRESDLDVGLLMDRGLRRGSRDRFEASTRLSAAVQAELGFARIDVVCLNDAPPVFARRVVLDGRRVYCRDAEADHAFVRTVMLRAADLEPFLRRTRELKMEAMAPR